MKIVGCKIIKPRLTTVIFVLYLLVTLSILIYSFSLLLRPEIVNSLKKKLGVNSRVEESCVDEIGSKLKAVIVKVEDVPPDIRKTADLVGIKADLQELVDEVSSLKGNMGEIEDVIADDSGKVLKTAMIEHDLAGLKEDVSILRTLVVSLYVLVVGGITTALFQGFKK